MSIYDLKSAILTHAVLATVLLTAALPANSAPPSEIVVVSSTAEGMAGLDEAVTTLTPEQQQMLQQFGLGVSQAAVTANQMAPSGSTAPGSATMPNEAQAAMSQAMSQSQAVIDAAMPHMTPEQLQMVQQMLGGLGIDITEMVAASPAAAGAGGPPSNSARVAKPSPPSAALTTDDLNQTAQNYLKALGYDPGNTDGAIDTMTMVAISQFQAENGLAVTGEVTPQLVGILAAEVDRSGSASGSRISD